MAVLLHVEDATARGSEEKSFHRVFLTNRDLECGNNGLRQTGGARRIVSLHAEDDFEMHG